MDREQQVRVDATREALKSHRPYSEDDVTAWIEVRGREQQARRLRYRTFSVLCAVSLVALGGIYFNHGLPPSLNFAAGLAAPTLLAGSWLAWWYTWQDEFNEATNERARRDGLHELSPSEWAAVAALTERHAVVAEIVRGWVKRNGLVLRERDIQVLAAYVDAVEARDQLAYAVDSILAGGTTAPG